jgi:hypothetical protein
MRMLALVSKPSGGEHVRKRGSRVQKSQNGIYRFGHIAALRRLLIPDEKCNRIRTIAIGLAMAKMPKTFGKSRLFRRIWESLPKLDVEGSSPFARSFSSQVLTPESPD